MLSSSIVITPTLPQTPKAAQFFMFKIQNGQFHATPPQFNLGKSFDTFGPIGPYLVSPDSVANKNSVQLECYINNELFLLFRLLVSRLARPGDWLMTLLAVNSILLLATITILRFISLFYISKLQLQLNIDRQDSPSIENALPPPSSCDKSDCFAKSSHKLHHPALCHLCRRQVNID